MLYVILIIIFPGKVGRVILNVSVWHQGFCVSVRFRIITTVLNKSVP